MKNIMWFLKKGMIIKDKTIHRIAENYLKKARDNIITMELLNKANKLKKELDLPEDYEPYEWIVICAYYSMYISALSVLAKIGFKSKNHTATRLALEEYFVKKKLLEQKYVQSLENVKLKRELLEELDKARDNREIAQYSPTKATTKKLAEESRKDAHEFVDRMEDLFDNLTA